MNTRNLFPVWLAVLAISGPGFAQGSRKQIEAAYAKSCRATELKFLDGFFAMRAPGFKAYSSKGELVDLVAERERMNQLFRPAQSVKAVFNVSNFREIDGRHAECDVHQTVTFKAVEGTEKKLVKFTFEARSRDQWVNTRRGWRLQSLRIASQFLAKGAP